MFQYFFARPIVSYKAVDVMYSLTVLNSILTVLALPDKVLHTPSLQGALQNPFRSLGVFLEKYLLPIM